MKEKILALRSRGLTYNEIKNKLGCAKSTVAYYCGEGQKEKGRLRKARHLSKRFLIGKISGFKSKGFRSKTRDFQRRNEEGMSNKQQSNFTMEDVLNKFGKNPICYLTGEKINLNDTKSYHFDHIIPFVKGGSNELDNLGLLTKDANLMKRHFLIDELITLCIKVLKHQGYKIRKAVEYA